MERIKKWLKQYKALYRAEQVIERAASVCPLIYHFRDYSSNKILRSILKLLVTPYYVIFRYFFGRKDIPGREGLALVLIAKDEATYIKEWLDFHIKQGVAQFIIFDNGSTDNFREVLSPYIDTGIVVYNFIKGKIRQADAYNMALTRYRKKFKYMGFIDADEFVFVRKNTDMGGGTGNLVAFMDDFMAAHPNAGGIAINWLIFGSSRHEKRPAGGVLENFTMCAERDFKANHETKTICDPAKVVSVNVHYPLYIRGFYNLGENGAIVDGIYSDEVHFDKIRINHYFGKSREEFIIKMNKGGANVVVGGRNMSSFEAYDRNELIDTEILSRR